MTEIKAQLLSGMDYVRVGRECDEIAFFGGSFTCLSKEMQMEILSLAAPYINQGLVKGIRISTRPDYITPEGLELLKKYKVTTIELGIQSTSDDVLAASGRGHTAADILNAAGLVKEYGFNLGLQMMVGLPMDTPDKSFKTALDMVALRPDMVRIYPTLILQDSPLEQLYRKGLYKPLELEDAVKQVSRLKLLFEYHMIPVIRTGLQANEELDTGTGYLAGPYHPAFGELVDSEIYYMWFSYIFGAEVSIENITNVVIFYVHPSNLSKAIGQKKSNILRLREKYFDRTYIMPDNDVEKDSVKADYIFTETFTRKAFIEDYLHRYMNY